MYRLSSNEFYTSKFLYLNDFEKSFVVVRDMEFIVYQPLTSAKTKECNDDKHLKNRI